MKTNYFLPLLAVLSVFIWLPGCGSDSPFEYIPVEGKITYEDDTPIPADGIVLRFVALDAEPVGNARPRPANASVNSEGVFTAVTSYKYGDGLVPGRHKVTINYAEDKEGNLLVPKEYTNPSETPLIVDTANLPLEIKVPKP